MRRSLRSWLWGVPVEQEVDEEIAFHLEMRTRELIDRGMDPVAARETALARAGDLAGLKRSCIDLGRKRDRRMRLTQWSEEFRDDVRFAVRQLKASPAFTMVAVLTLALGIGANSAIFALADAALLRPLPYPHPERLVALWEAEDSRSRDGVNPLEFVDWSERNRTFDAIAAYLPGTGRAMTGADGVAEQIPSLAVTPRFFDVFRVQPQAGRLFRETDASAPDVVVIEEGFWRSRFGGDPTLVGHALRIEGQQVTVIGIVPEGFRFGSALGGQRPRLWTLLGTPTQRSTSARYAHYFNNVVGRLRPGVTLEGARADMTAVAEGIARESPATNEGHGVAIEPLRELLVGDDLRLTSMLLLGVVGFVLLMCCANVANLVLARASSRARELAVRSALGAGRQRIVRQLLTESLVLSALAAMVGTGIGLAILQAAPSMIPPNLMPPPPMMLSFDGRLAAFCGATALGVAMIFGLLSARQATGASLMQTAIAGGRTATGHGARFRTIIATGEVAIAVLLLCGSGLLLRTLSTLGGVDPGHRAHNVLTMNVSPGMSNDQQARRRFYDAVEREVRSIPGVRNVALGSALPFDGLWYGQSFQIEGDPERPQAGRDGAGYQIVSASYFQTLGIPILAGRDFTDRDTADAIQVCIVNEAFVRRYLSGRVPLRTRLSVNAMVQPAQAVLREIVGVVKQVKERPGETEDQPHVYVPLAQDTWLSASLVVRAAEPPATALTPAIRAAVARVNPDRAVTTVRTLDDIEREATATPRFRAVLVGTFAGLALMLATVGVFGVLAYSVQQRRREFGVRMALGATTGGILRLVAANAVRLVGVGAAIGLVAAVVFGRLISSFLFGVEPLDPITYAVVALLIAATAAMAAMAPALRATRIDPAVTFRAE